MNEIMYGVIQRERYIYIFFFLSKEGMAEQTALAREILGGQYFSAPYIYREILVYLADESIQSFCAFFFFYLGL